MAPMVTYGAFERVCDILYYVQINNQVDPIVEEAKFEAFTVRV